MLAVVPDLCHIPLMEKEPQTIMRFYAVSISVITKALAVTSDLCIFVCLCVLIYDMEIEHISVS